MRRYGFGPVPAFEVLLAEAGGRAVGYALFSGVFDTDRARPGLLLSDLYVEAGARRRGVGRALMAAVARAARDRGAASVVWNVLARNAGARRFYAGLGARDAPMALLLELDGAALAALAGPRPGGG